MSIQSEITRINSNIAAAYTAVSGKGGTLPAAQNSENLANAISTIHSGREKLLSTRSGSITPLRVVAGERATLDAPILNTNCGGIS